MLPEKIKSIRFLHWMLSVAFSPLLLTAQADFAETGIATYYADYLHGQSTALGEIYNRYELTGAHKSHPKGTLLKITRLDNNQSVTVRVNDRIRPESDIMVNLSLAAAMELGLTQVGKAWVRIETAGYSNLNPVNPYREQLPARDVSSYDNNVGNRFTIKGAGSDRSPAVSESLIARSPYATSGSSSSAYETYAADRSAADAALSSGYGIQVGSFSVYDNAERSMQTLRNAGISNVYVKQSASADGAILYRVIIGAFSSRTTAADYLQRLRSAYLADGIVITLGK